MKTLFRILGTAAAVAVTGAAIVALDKILNQKDPLHVEEVEFPEEAEQDAEEAEKTAEVYAEGEAKAEQPAEAEAAAPETPAEPEAPAQPVPEEAPAAEAPAYDPEAPNPNPVEAGPAVAPKDENGKFDPTKIAEPSDFGDWEEQGCKGRFFHNNKEDDVRCIVLFLFIVLLPVAAAFSCPAPAHRPGTAAPSLPARSI